MGLVQELLVPEASLVIIAALLGAIIGLERELAGKDPSLRTFSLICVGSCLFSVISRLSVIDTPMADPSRIAAQIVTGIGFLGAGVIFNGQGKVSGLTTAALIWVTAAIGVAVGFGQISLAITTTFIVLAVILLLKLVHALLGNNKKVKKNGHLTSSIE